MKKKNTWGRKLNRTITSMLPICEDREGDCHRCGACCALPNKCPFLKFEDEQNQKNSVCTVYHIRPLNCRKYPRVKRDLITDPCGYNFN
ncbi:hypothetical protein ACFLQ8_01650 [Candidatus Auribacterota bacterium]